MLRPAAQHRRAGTRAPLATDLEAPLAWLHARLATLDDARETRRRASPLGRDNAALWQRAPGLGPVWARTVGLALPAWGTRPRPQSAAVGGVAPRHCASGPLRGWRRMWGGRAHVRPVLSMGSLVATRDHPRRQALYERRRAAGKGKKVALTACRRQWLTILNARVRQRTPWPAQEVQG